MATATARAVLASCARTSRLALLCFSAAAWAQSGICKLLYNQTIVAPGRDDLRYGYYIRAGADGQVSGSNHECGRRCAHTRGCRAWVRDRNRHCRMTASPGNLTFRPQNGSVSGLRCNDTEAGYAQLPTSYGYEVIAFGSTACSRGWSVRSFDECLLAASVLNVGGLRDYVWQGYDYNNPSNCSINDYENGDPPGVMWNTHQGLPAQGPSAMAPVCQVPTTTHTTTRLKKVFQITTPMILGTAFCFCGGCIGSCYCCCKHGCCDDEGVKAARARRERIKKKKAEKAAAAIREAEAEKIYGLSIEELTLREEGEAPEVRGASAAFGG